MDGFRFDLASCLCRDPQGHPLAAPPLIRELAKDPVLSKVRLASMLPHHCQQMLVAGKLCKTLGRAVLSWPQVPLLQSPLLLFRGAQCPPEY